MVCCPKCNGFCQRLNGHTPREYQEIVRQLIETVKQGVFLLVRASCPLEDILGRRCPATILLTSSNVSLVDASLNCRLTRTMAMYIRSPECYQNHRAAHQNPTETLLALLTLGAMTRIRPIIEEDLPLVRAWMREAAEAPRWSEGDLTAVIRASSDHRRLRRGWVAEQDDAGAVGFVIAAALCIPGEPAECELEFILVTPQARGRGIGRMLIHEVAEWARGLMAEEIWLEVRESNTRARRLYERCGFAGVGRRQGYYADPPEDALRMLLRIRD